MNKTALITGGAIRIGKSLAESCADLGYRLIIHYHHSADEANVFSKSLNERGIEHCLVNCDLSDRHQVEHFFELIPDEFKPVDLLINSAAVFPEQDEVSNFNEHWHQVMSINAYAPLELSRQFAQQQKMNGDCQIINIVDARLSKAQGEHFVYRMTKSMLMQATKDLAMALAPDIRVNAIAPGAILPPPGKGQDHLNRLAADIPLKRTGDLTHVKNALKYLVEQPFVTGEVLVLDGGEFL